MNHQLKLQDPSESQEASAWKFFGATLLCLGAVMLPLCLVTLVTGTSGRIFVPLLVIPLIFGSGAALGAAALWSVLRCKARLAARAGGSPTQLQALEERLANLETINSFERRLAEEALSREKTAPLR